MPYPDSAMAQGEQVVLHRHPHWKCLIRPSVVFIVVTGLAVFLTAVVNTQQWHQTVTNVSYAVIWGIWLLAIGWLTLRPLLRWLTTHFVVTNRRVMFRQGVLTRSGIDIPLARINSVEFQDRISERIFRSGTLIIESASMDPLEFHDIPRLREVHALLYHEVFDTLGSEEASS
ncbi:MAG: PH domain-containing protein [Mycobacteriaceae bacterium]|nr:PH domain-containing protein [Mycobacteriaceae bacterium]